MFQFSYSESNESFRLACRQCWHENSFLCGSPRLLDWDVVLPGRVYKVGLDYDESNEVLPCDRFITTILCRITRAKGIRDIVISVSVEFLGRSNHQHHCKRRRYIRDSCLISKINSRARHYYVFHSYNILNSKPF